jgi:hypothetical protein
MALYAGDTVAIKVQLTDPFSGAPLTGHTVTLDLYVPGRNPKTNTSVRATPDVSGINAAWDGTVVNSDSTTGAYIGYVDSTGFAAGTWSFRATAVGPVYHNMDFGSFKLSA